MPATHVDDSIIGRISALLREVDPTEKSASDPGGFKGQSSHPTAKADDGTSSPKPGERANEHERDVKSMVPSSIDDAEPGDSGTQDDRQLSIGLHAAATGEDPSVEDDYKGHKEDPGSDHPATVDGGEKYSSYSYDRHLKEATYKVNQLIVTLSGLLQQGVDLEAPVKSAAQQTQPQTQTQQSKTASHEPTPEEAAQAGYALAEAMASSLGMDKQAAAQAVVERTIQDAVEDAVQVAALCRDFHRSKAAAQRKRAGGDMPPEMAMDPAAMEGGPGGDGGAPPEAAPVGGGMDAPVPPGGEEMGGEEMGGEGDLPPEAGPGGEGGHEAALQELLMALQEQGIAPEEVIAALQSAHGSGDMPPIEGEPAPSPEEKTAWAKAASALPPRVQHMAKAMCKRASHARFLGNATWNAIQLRDAGKFQWKEARGQARAERDEIKGFIREVCGLSR